MKHDTKKNPTACAGVVSRFNRYTIEGVSVSREPSSVAILACRIQRAYPSLSCYSAASLAHDLERIERAQRKHATRQCNGPSECPEDVPGYFRLVPLPAGQSPDPRAPRGKTWADDEAAEERAGERIEKRVAKWIHDVQERADRLWDEEWQDRPVVTLEHDPRGAVLLVQFPGEAQAVSA